MQRRPTVIRKRAVAAVALVVVLGATGCGGAGGGSAEKRAATSSSSTSSAPATPGTSASSPSAAPSAAAGLPQHGATVTADVFADALKKNPSMAVIDVRTPQEFAGGHLQSARNIDVDGDYRGQVAGLDRNSPYALYCRSAKRSGEAMRIMQEMGFTHVFHLGGGIIDWKRTGKQVVAD